MSSLFLTTWVLLLQLSRYVNANGRLLAVPLPFISHVNAMLRLCDEVENYYGYQTTVILTEQQAKHPALMKTRADVVISRGMGMVDHEKLENTFAKKAFEDLSFWELLDMIKQLRATCEHTLEDKDLFEDLGRKRFDLAIIDNFLSSTCFSVIPYKLSIPFVHFGRAIDPRRMRIVVNPAVYPFGIDRGVTDKMTFTQRIVNVIDQIIWHSIEGFEFTPNDVVGRFAPERQHLTNHQLQAQTQLYLLDFDELMDFHLPVYPNMKFVGGLVTQPVRSLPQDVKSFVDSAENGIVVVSFGSLVKEFPDDFLKKLYHMFELKDLRFIFKYGNVTKIETNVMYMPWIPQNDLLGHPNTRAFITHCGNRGQFEALYHGIPMLGIPLFADQLYNAARMKAKGYGLYLDVRHFSQEELVHNINEILTNLQYKNAIRKASIIFRNRPEVPSKRAAFWINHVIKYGGLHLRSEAAVIPYYQYLLLDVISFILGMLAFIVFVLYFALKCCLWLFRARKSKVE